MVIRQKSNGVNFKLVDSIIEERGGVKVKNAYWLECDSDGNIADGNEDGVLENETIICRIPEGKDDIDLSTLSENCLK